MRSPRPKGRNRRYHGRLCAAALLAVLGGGLAGCARPYLTVEPGGVLPILGPSPQFDAQAMPGTWIVVGDSGVGRLRAVTANGLPALRVTGGERAAAWILRVRTPLIDTPFLQWSWLMGAHGGARHPVHLVVGFRRPQTPKPWFTGSLPVHDRLLLLWWGRTALARGTLEGPFPGPDGEPSVGHYTVRGGAEELGNWRIDSVDLLALYRRLWPADRAAGTTIVFVGIAADPGAPPAMANFSAVTLTR